jgi:hypothetical protein
VRIAVNPLHESTPAGGPGTITAKLVSGRREEFRKSISTFTWPVRKSDSTSKSCR